jgi:lipopolysaccharide/colanic/teichoic acid biosynthesis glycosyltransferase
MTLVGPRPCIPREVLSYEDTWKQRMYVTPGLTCYWQITPYRNDVSFEEWMNMDLKYIRERSFLVDWKIIFKTVGTVLRKQGE